MSQSKLCLSIIVKNEERVIRRMLETVWPILDHYIVVDTGSTDNTKQIVEDFFKDKGIPGKVVDHEWINFCTARNFARVEAEKTGCSHSFWIDADEQLIIDPAFKKESFLQALDKLSGAAIETEYGPTRYNRHQIWSNTAGYYWYGPVHEFLKTDQVIDTPTGFIKGIHTLVTPDGNSWTSMSQQEKYERDSKILLDYVKTDPKKDPRWVFYLAQSYRDAVTIENAIESVYWYDERIKRGGGYVEELYWSQFQIANLKIRINHELAAAKKPVKYSDTEIVDDLMKCSDFDSLRAEHFVILCKFYERQRRFESMYILISYAFKKFHKKNPYPKRGLFLDPETYSWKIADCLNIAAWYTNRKSESRKAINQCMNAVHKGLVTNPGEAERIRNNLKFDYNAK